MAEHQAKLQALATEILELSKTHQLTHAPGSQNELVSKANELISAAQSPMDHAQALLASLVEASTIRTLVSLKVLQTIPTYGSITLAELESITGAQAALLERLLRVVVGSGIIMKSQDGTYARTSLSEAYTGMIGNFFCTFYDELTVMTSLPDYLKARGRREPDGEQATTHNPNSWKFGQEGKTAFEILEQNPEKLNNFQMMLGMMERLRPTTGFYDFSKLANSSEDGKAVFVDVGGATGKTITKILEVHPEIKPEQCVLQDRQQVIELARQNSHLPEGVKLQPHDFFQPQPVKGAKAYHLRAICHDWSDKMVIKILQNIVPAMASDSKVLIAEYVLPESGVSRMAACLDMMMLCIGGKERTKANFEAVLDAAGLKLDGVFQAPGSTDFAVVEVSDVQPPDWLVRSCGNLCRWSVRV